MSSFMKQFISKESLEEGVVEAVDDITPEEEVELVEANAEAEFVRRDIEQAGEAFERVRAVQDELQAQNEVAEGIMEANGGQLPMEAAAGIEAGRRAAAVALGLDPESEEGQAIVDQPQIDAMVRGESQPATEDDNKSKGLIATLKKIWTWIVEKFKAGIKWISKATNIIPKKFKDVYVKLKAMSDEDFNKVVEQYKDDEEIAKRYSNLFENGKLIDLDDKSKMVKKLIDASKLGMVDSVTYAHNSAKQTEESSNKLVELAAKTVQRFKSAVGKDTFTLNGYTFGFEIVGTDVTLKKEELPKLSKVPVFTRKDALSSVNVGLINQMMQEVNQMSFEMSKEVQKGQLDNIDKLPPEAQDGVRKSTSIIQKLTSAFLDIVNGYNKVASDMAAMLGLIVKKAENKETDAGETKALPYNG